MKKRIFSLALVLGFVLALSASAWAAGNYSIISSKEEFEAARVDVNYSESMTIYWRDTSDNKAVGTSFFTLLKEGESYSFTGTDNTKNPGDLVSSITINGLTITLSDTGPIQAGSSSAPNPVTLSVSGKPVTKGEVSFYVQACNSALKSDTRGKAKFTLKVKVKAATSAPKITTSTIAAQKHGQSLDVTIESTGNVDDDEEIVNLYIKDPAIKTQLESKYGIVIANDEKGALTLKSDKLLNTAAGISFVVVASNDYCTKVGQATEKTFILKVDAVSPTIATPADQDLVKAVDGVEVFTVNTADDKFTIDVVTSEATANMLTTPTGDTLTTANLKITAPKASTSGFPEWLDFAVKTAPTNDPLSTATYQIKRNGKPIKAGTYTFNLEASNAGLTGTGKSTKSYRIFVMDSPDISRNTLSNTTYGAKPSTTKIQTTGGTKEFPVTATVDLGSYASILTATPVLNANTGQTTITIEGDLNENNVSAVTFGSEKTVSDDIKITLSNPAFTETKEVLVKAIFIAAKPTISDKSDLQKEKYTGKSGDPLEESITITATGPGKISWDISGLPAGLTSTDSGTGTLTIEGTPSEAAKNKRVTVKAINGAGNDSVNLTFDIDANPPEITFADSEKFTADHKVKAPLDDAKDFYEITATNGPVKWTATLPSGIKLTQSGDSRAILTGTFNSAFDKKAVITAKNSVTNKSATWSADVKVYAEPKISATIPGPKIDQDYTTDKPLTTLKGTNVSSWQVKFLTPGGTEISNLGLTLGGDDSDKIIGTITALPDSGDVKTDTVIARITAKNSVFTEGVSKDVKMKITAEAPKLKTSRLPNFDTGTAGTAVIEVTGTKPIKMYMYIKKEDAIKAGATTTAADISLYNDKLGATANTGSSFRAAEANAFNLSFTASADATGGLLKSTTGGLAAKSLPITVSLDNGVGKPVVKKLTLKIDAEAPKWMKGTDEVSKDMTFTYKAGDAVAEFVSLTASGGEPLTITSSLKEATNGVNATITDKTVKIFADAVDDAPAKTVKVTLTAKNAATGKSAKISVSLVGQVKPEITTAEKNLQKSFIQGARINLALAAKGTKPISWDLGAIKLGNSDLSGGETTLASDYGISFDRKNGKFTSTSNVTSNKITKTDAGVATSLDIEVKAGNAAGESDPVHVFIAITGGKPKIVTKTLTFTIGSADKLPLLASGVTSNEVTWTKEGDLPAGLTLSETKPQTVDMGSGATATKGTSVKFKVDNFGNSATGTVKIIINDPTPTLPTIGTITLATPDAPTSKDKYKTQTVISVDKEVTISTNPATGSSKITWTAGKPTIQNASDTSVTANNVTVKLVKDNSSTNANQNKVTLNVQLKKGTVLYKNDAYVGFTATFKLTAKNSSNTVAASQDITITMAAPTAGSDTSTDDVTAVESETRESSKTEDELVAEELKVGLGEGELSIGAERAESTLTAEQRALIESEGYMIAAILPEISATADGQYGLEVDLFAAAPAGAELKWLAFPQAPAQPS
ncbi:MAG: hypothetical protein IJT21_08375, partial [Synergistaceae bacterium]|nr:hypothetical protein [Synergistaceae bacterium]